MSRGTKIVAEAEVLLLASQTIHLHLEPDETVEPR